MSDELKFADGTDDAPRRQESRSETRNDRSDRDDRRDDRDDRDDRRNDRKDREETGRNWNMGSLARASGRPRLGGVSDAALAAMIESFNQAKQFDSPSIQPEIQRSRFKVLPFTGSAAGSSLPSLLVCLPIKAPKFGEGVLVYTMVIEQPGAINLRPQTSRGESFDALLLAEDRLTDKYIKAIKEEVEGLGQGRAVIIGSQVILASIVGELTDKDTGSQAIAKIYDNAIDALCGYRQNIIDTVAGNRDSQFRLNPKAIDRGDRLEASFDYSGLPGQDSSGLPIRTDGLATIYYSAQSDDEDNVFNRIPMVQVRVSLDLFLDDNDRDSSRTRLGRRRRGRDDRDENPAFMQPVININAISSVEDYPYSLELIQLGLGGGAALFSSDLRWYNMLRPRNNLGGRLKPVFKLADLALLADLDPDVRDEIMERVSPNMDEGDFADFVDDIVKPDVAYGMVIPTSSERSWALNIFVRIATSKDSVEVDELCARLFDSADVLTGNRFREEYRRLNDGAMPIPVSSNGCRQLIGTWVDPDTSVLRDLREWNVPAVASKVGAKNPEAVRDFQYTFEDNRHSPEYSLAERYNMINKWAPGVRPVATAEQLVLRTTYLKALAIALDKARMSPVVSSGDAVTGRRTVGNSLFSDNASSDLGVSRRRGGDRDGRGRSGGGLFGGSDRYY